MIGNVSVIGNVWIPTIIIDNGNLLDRLLPQHHMFCFRIPVIQRQLDKEHLVRLPLVVVDHLDVQMLLTFVFLKHQGLLDRDVVLLSLRCAIYSLQSETQHRKIEQFFSSCLNFDLVQLPGTVSFTSIIVWNCLTGTGMASYWLTRCLHYPGYLNNSILTEVLVDLHPQCSFANRTKSMYMCSFPSHHSSNAQHTDTQTFKVVLRSYA